MTGANDHEMALVVEMRPQCGVCRYVTACGEEITPERSLLMSPSRSVFLVTACLAALTGQSATARDRVLAFSVTAGAIAQPEYFGADSFRFGPTARIGFTGLRVGSLQLRDPDGPREFAPGTRYRGAVQYIPDRDGRDELEGLSNVDASVELGLGLQHTRETWQVYGELRYGFIGHQAIAAEIGANAILRLEGGAVLHAGPRVELGNSRFMRTYFGVTDTEAARSDLDAYTPSRALYSAGFEIGAYQPVGEDWGVTAIMRYDRLRGDASRSPIVDIGTENQWTATLGLAKHFNLRF